MNATIYNSNIRTWLHRLVEEIQLANSLNLHNDAVQAENFFCDFLNRVFGWKLTNANQESFNQDTFDLVDKRRKIYVQVTSTKSCKKKYDKLIESAGQIPKGASLILLYMSKKVKADYLKKRKIKGVNYEGYDLFKLLTSIYYTKKTAISLRPLNDLLQAELAPIVIAQGSSGSDTARSPIQALRTKDGINRVQLLTDLFVFTQKDDGLLTGGPGYGKSFIIDQLQNVYREKGLQCFVIRINELITGDDADISEQIGLGANWLKALQSVSAGKTKHLLVFDAFDTAKDAKINAAILKYIAASKRQLAGFNILASVRTYDAMKSFALRELFPQELANRNVSCRHFEVPELTSDELQSFLKKHRLTDIYDKTHESLKTFLTVPYFLDLFYQLTGKNRKISDREIKAIHSEEQLLHAYWSHKVPMNSTKELFLEKLAQILSGKEALSCRRSEIISEQNIAVYDELVSDGLLSSGIPSQHVSYSHNILLDYAISRYVLLESAREMIAFVEQKQRHPFIFRSSYVFFYSRLWVGNRDLFWEHYVAISQLSTPLFRLFHQTVLNYVLSTCFETTADLEKVFTLPEEERARAIRKILESIRFVRKTDIGSTEISLFLQCSQQIHPAFIWELGFLINVAIVTAKQQSSSGNLRILAACSSHYLAHVLQYRKQPELKFAMERNGGSWAIKNYCELFSLQENPEVLIQQVLDILKEEDFPITLLYHLAEYFVSILSLNPELAVTIYNTIYRHSETSTKETYLGGSVVMALRSNRQQDFNSLIHRLEKVFVDMLKVAPETVIKLGCELVNYTLLDQRTYYKERPELKIEFAGKECAYVTDHSFYEYKEEKEYGILSHVNNIFKFLHDELNQEHIIQVRRYLVCFAQYAKASTLWIRLLRFISKRKPHFKNQAFQLLCNGVLLGSTELTYHIGDLIKTYWTGFSKREQKLVEQKIASLTVSLSNVYDEDDLLVLKQKLLSCIPATSVNTEEADALLTKYGRSEPEPDDSSSILRPYNESKADKMHRLGLNTGNTDDVNLYDNLLTVESFYSSYHGQQTKKLLKSTYTAVYQTARKLFDTVNHENHYNKKIVSHTHYEVALFAKLLVERKIKLPVEIKAWIHTVCDYCMTEPAYMRPYEDGDISTRLGGFSPNARSIAVDILVALLYTEKTEAIMNALRTLMSDNTQHIRFKALGTLNYFWGYHRDIFWAILRERLPIEQDGLCLQILIKSVNYRDIIEAYTSEVENVIVQFRDIVFIRDIADEIVRSYANLLITLHIYHHNTIAKDIIKECTDSKKFSRQLLILSLPLINPNKKDFDDATYPDEHRQVIDMVKNILVNAFDRMSEKQLDDPAINDDLETIDFCIQQLYFTVIREKEKETDKPFIQRNRKAYFGLVKELLSLTVERSKGIHGGFMVAHTGYYFMQLVNELFDYDPAFMLELSVGIVDCAAANNFTYDSSTLGEIIKLSERIFSDHKDLLSDPVHFKGLLSILDHFSNSGWQEALELTWKLKDIF